jgi:hypothetical protein
MPVHSTFFFFSLFLEVLRFELGTSRLLGRLSLEPRSQRFTALWTSTLSQALF